MKKNHDSNKSKQHNENDPEQVIYGYDETQVTYEKLFRQFFTLTLQSLTNSVSTGKNLTWYTIGVIFSIFYVAFCISSMWRGVWVSQDKYVFVENIYLNNFMSFIFGSIALTIAVVTRLPLSYISKKVSACKYLAIPEFYPEDYKRSLEEKQWRQSLKHQKQRILAQIEAKRRKKEKDMEKRRKKYANLHDATENHHERDEEVQVVVFGNSPVDIAQLQDHITPILKKTDRKSKKLKHKSKITTFAKENENSNDENQDQETIETEIVECLSDEEQIAILPTNEKDEAQKNPETDHKKTEEEAEDEELARKLVKNPTTGQTSPTIVENFYDRVIHSAPFGNEKYVNPNDTNLAALVKENFFVPQQTSFSNELQNSSRNSLSNSISTQSPSASTTVSPRISSTSINNQTSDSDNDNDRVPHNAETEDDENQPKGTVILSNIDTKRRDDGNLIIGSPLSANSPNSNLETPLGANSVISPSEFNEAMPLIIDMGKGSRNQESYTDSPSPNMDNKDPFLKKQESSFNFFRKLMYDADKFEDFSRNRGRYHEKKVIRVTKKKLKEWMLFAYFSTKFAVLLTIVLVFNIFIIFMARFLVFALTKVYYFILGVIAISYWRFFWTAWDVYTAFVFILFF